MLPGIIIKPLKRLYDERGSFTEVMRRDWAEVFSEEIVQANMSISYPGIVRAWHKHERGQIDCFLVARGALKICAYDDESKELDEIISTGESPQIVKVPGHYWHGFGVVGNEPAILVYFVNRLYDYKSPDEVRRPWDDPTIVPALINGKTGDPRCVRYGIGSARHINDSNSERLDRGLKMKALILSGGHGTRLRPITYSQQKQLIPIANKPILFYPIEDVIEAGAEEVGIIVGPNKEQVIETVNSRQWDADIEFIYQGEPKGLAHAILVAESFLGDEEFTMYLGDNIIKDGITQHAEKFRSLSPDSLVLLTKVDDPQRFGVAEFDDQGRLKRLVEKPRVPPSSFALAGIYFFNPVIIEACKSIKPSWRNELEITDAIQWLIANGCKVEASSVEGWWKDTGKAGDILDANRLILDGMDSKNEGILKDSRLFGRAVIGSGSIIENSIVKGPCIIGRNCRISNTYIGPYTSINDKCIIEGAEIEDSVIMERCNIIKAGRILESLIGKDVRIEKNGVKPVGSKFIVGDNSDIVL